MNEGIRVDLEFIRSERGKGNPCEVIRRAEEVRVVLGATRNEVHAEASMHLAWAYGQEGRNKEAFALYTELLTDGLKKSSPLLYMQTLCDHACMLHARGPKVRPSAAFV